MSQWHCKIGDRQLGPISTWELKHLARTGQLQPTDLLKKDGTKTWAHASAVRGLFGRHEHDEHGPELELESMKTPVTESALHSPRSPPVKRALAPAGPVDATPRRKLSTRDKLGVAAIGFSLVLIVAAIGFAIGRKPRRPIAYDPVQVAAKAPEPQTPASSPVTPPVETGAKVNAPTSSQSEPQVAPPSAPPPAAAGGDQPVGLTPPEVAAPNVSSPQAAPDATRADVAPPTPPPAASPGDQTPALEPPPVSAPPMSGQNPVPAPTPAATETPASPPVNASVPPAAPATPATPAPPAPPAGFVEQEPPAGFPRLDAADAGGMAPAPPGAAAAAAPPPGAEAEADGPAPPDPRDDAYCQQVQQLLEQTEQLLTELRANQNEVRKIWNDCDQVKQTINAATVQIPQLMLALQALDGPPLPGADMVPLEQRGMQRRQLEAQLNLLMVAKRDSEKRLEYELPRKLREAESNVTQVLRKCDQMHPQWITLSDPFAEQSRAAHVRVGEMCTEWLADGRDFIAGYLMRGFARWHAGQADQAVKDFDQVVQGCQALQSVQVRSDGQVVPGGQGRKLTKNEQDVLAAALSGQAVVYAEKGQEGQTKAKCGEAADLCPKSALVCIFRGRANAMLGKTRAAIEDLLKATRLDSRESAGFRELARLLATSPTLNEGKRAVDFGHTACQLTDWKQWQSLDAYALANAKNGTFEEAVKWGQKTLEIAPYDARPGLEERLKLYQARVVPTNVKSR